MSNNINISKILCVTILTQIFLNLLSVSNKNNEFSENLYDFPLVKKL